MGGSWPTVADVSPSHSPEKRVGCTGTFLNDCTEVGRMAGLDIRELFASQGISNVSTTA